MKIFYKKYLPFLTILFLYSCSATKFVPDGEYLLDKVKIESDVPGYKTFELKPYVRQLPNYKMFGLNKTKFQLYNLAGKDSSNRLNRFVQKIGEPPVIFDSTLVYKTTSEFRKLFVNKGYLNVNVSPEISLKNKKADVVYRIKGNEPYRIRNYSQNIEDEVIDKELTTRAPMIKEGILFDRDMLNQERTRISDFLRNRGYYAFNRDFISYEADSALNSFSVDLNMKLGFFREPSSDGKTIEIPHRKYYFDKIYLYLDFDPLKLNDPNEYVPSDSLSINGYTVYYQGEKPSIRVKTLLDNCFMLPQSAYSQSLEEETYSAFSALNALNNIHIHFDEFMRNDTNWLNVGVVTMPAQKQTVTYSVEGTNTAGNLGVASSANYTHRNLFRGSETFNFKVRGAYETIKNFDNPYTEIGGEASIHIPKFIVPFINDFIPRYLRASTEFSLSYNYQNRPEYNRTLLSGGIQYTWRKEERFAAQHQVDLLDIDYVYLPKKDSIFMNRLPSGAKYFGYTDQFIVSSGYSYTKTTFDPTQTQRNAYSFRASLESAGNLLYLLNRIGNVEKDAQGSYQLLNTLFAQFVKGDVNYAKTIVLDKQNSIAWRIGSGIGFPYGNSKMLPFEKRYFSGGANSVRAWPVRELGPGKYQRVDSTTFFHQSGDIKMDFNIEYRSRFFWKLEAAAFIDAGNIWTIRNYEGQENGAFKFNSFYKEIAVGYGIGLRLVMDYFLVRFDCGWKAYDPSLWGKEAWVIKNPNFTSNWAWHIAVGYPF
ncbi:MAG: sorting and assembly machinery component 50 [Dysgonamonadaceae bacterium]|nr:sorting and assembly machinery component 50 [Dysgonamonadaceae bacterium]